MKYPKFIKQGDTIGICAPSSGVGKFIQKYKRSIDNLHAYGYQTKETASVRNESEPSNTSIVRAKEVEELLLDQDVDMIMVATGGDFLFDILPHLNPSIIQENSKWIMGASDPTGLVYPITTKYDIATLYGENAGDYYATPTPDYLERNLAILKGDLVVQHNYPRRMEQPPFFSDDIIYDKDSIWKSTSNTIDVEGRCIGGCIDVLKDLIGTPYDGTLEFIERYRNDGIIWYFDNFAMNSETLYRTLLQMKYIGWFQTTKAIMIGRTCFESNSTGLSYEGAIKHALQDIPVIYDADIGHTVPHITMINCAMLHLHYKDGQASLQFELK